MTDPGRPNKPVSLRCRLNLPDEETFIRKYAEYISKNSVFAKTDQPRNVGEEILFEFSLMDGTELLRGLGRVAWNRKNSEAGKPPGMSIRILKLGKKGKAMLERVAAYKEQRETEVGESRETPTPPAADECGEPAEQQPRGADTDMTDENRKSAEKIDLDAIDSMLDQIAKAPVSKKKRVIRRRSKAAASAKRTSKVAPPAESFASSVIEPETPAAVEAAASEETPAVVESPVPEETPAVVESAMPEVEAVALDETPGGEAAEREETSAVEAASPEETPAVEAVASEEASEIIAASSEEALVEEHPVSDASAETEDVLEPEEIEELSADEMILEEPEMSVDESVEENDDDEVMDLGPESETSQDVATAENVSVVSVVPPAVSSPPVGFDSAPPDAPVEPPRPSAPSAPRMDPRAPIYGSYPSVSSAPPAAPAVSSYLPPERPSFTPGVDPRAPIYSSAPPPPAPQATATPVSVSSAPPRPSAPSMPPMPPTPSVPPMPLAPSVPPAMPLASSVPPPRDSQVPVVEMAAEELQGILGAPTVDDAEVRTAMIQEDELDALLNALEDGESEPLDMDDVEEISDFDELEVVEVDD